MAVAEVTRSARGRQVDTALGKLRAGVQAMTAWVGEAEAEGLGEALIQIREAGIDPLEAVFASGVRRFDKSGEYKADGALSLTAWLRWKCKLSGGAAMERVEIARQLEKLPQTQAAFASGDVGYQHVAVLARSPRPTTPTSGATFISASPSTAWSGSMASSMPRAARRCGRRCSPSCSRSRTTRAATASAAPRPWSSSAGTVAQAANATAPGRGRS